MYRTVTLDECIPAALNTLLAGWVSIGEPLSYCTNAPVVSLNRDHLEARCLLNTSVLSRVCKLKSFPDCKNDIWKSNFKSDEGMLSKVVELTAWEGSDLRKCGLWWADCSSTSPCSTKVQGWKVPTWWWSSKGSVWRNMWDKNADFYQKQFTHVLSAYSLIIFCLYQHFVTLMLVLSCTLTMLLPVVRLQKNWKRSVWYLEVFTAGSMAEWLKQYVISRGSEQK